jgi:hypothetical protein
MKGGLALFADERERALVRSCASAKSVLQYRKLISYNLPLQGGGEPAQQQPQQQPTQQQPAQQQQPGADADENGEGAEAAPGGEPGAEGGTDLKSEDEEADGAAAKPKGWSLEDDDEDDGGGGEGDEDMPEEDAEEDADDGEGVRRPPGGRLRYGVRECIGDHRSRPGGRPGQQPVPGTCSLVRR